MCIRDRIGTAIGAGFGAELRHAGLPGLWPAVASAAIWGFCLFFGGRRARRTRFREPAPGSEEFLAAHPVACPIGLALLLAAVYAPAAFLGAPMGLFALPILLGLATWSDTWLLYRPKEPRHGLPTGGASRSEHQPANTGAVYDLTSPTATSPYDWVPAMEIEPRSGLDESCLLYTSPSPRD